MIEGLRGQSHACGGIRLVPSTPVYSHVTKINAYSKESILKAEDTAEIREQHKFDSTCDIRPYSRYYQGLDNLARGISNLMLFHGPFAHSMIHVRRSGVDVRIRGGIRGVGVTGAGWGFYVRVYAAVQGRNTLRNKQEMRDYSSNLGGPLNMYVDVDKMKM